MNLLEPLNFALGLAVQTGDLLLAQRQQASMQLKADGSLVTSADLAADHLIFEALRTHFPAHGIISEELSHRCGPQEWQWVVDPLDGTTNYASGLPFWGVLLALLCRGWPVMAVAHFPCLQETYHAVQGGGAFCNGRLLRASQTAVPPTHQLLVTCSRSWRHLEVRGVSAKPRVLGAIGYDFALVARGAAAFGLAVAPHLWDLAGGWLLLAEAGGATQPAPDAHNQPRHPFPVQEGVDYRDLTFPIVMAADPALMQSVGAHSDAPIRIRQVGAK